MSDETLTADVTTKAPSKRKVNRISLTYKVFEVQVEEGEDGEEDRLVLVEAATPKTEKPGSQAVLRALKAKIQEGDDSYNGKTLVVAGLGEEITVAVENKRVVKFG